MQYPTRLRDIAERYDAILCDVWGVIRDGRALIPSALTALSHFRALGKPVVLISNSPRRSTSLLHFMAEMGAPSGPRSAAWDGAVTSGDATYDLLTGLAPGPAYKLGPDYDDALYEGTGLTFVPTLEDARFIACTGLIDYENETPEEYRGFLTQALDLELPMVCANPDLIVQVGDRLLLCGGALAALYEQMEGVVFYAGKPHPPIYDLAYRQLQEITGHGIEKEAILAIGDGPVTDILGAQQEGLDCLFIGSGIAGQTADPVDSDRLGAILATEGVNALYGAEYLRW